MQNKKKFKFKRFILWSLAVVLVVGVSGLFAANYAVNKVIDSMANSLEAELESELEFSSNATVNTNKETVSESSQGDDTETTVDKPIPETTNAEDNTNTKQPSMVEVKVNEKDKVGVYAPEVSTDKALAIKENVTISEKADVTSILMGNLSLLDLKLFQQMASGGMTVDEKREARKLLLDKLTPEEYNILSQIAKKYGVSQGKTYDQVEKEEANAAK
ncbi:hypothetical protein [Cohnella sp.]|uniref:hypothetical protein n=1 Tax=Cohnella sp. TaxID=1883426 RepID=UPI003563C2E0